MSHNTPTIQSQPLQRQMTLKRRPIRYGRRALGDVAPAASSAKQAVHKKYLRRKKLALLLPGHNEELIIATTIRSAIIAGQRKSDIFVVDDNSSDKTRQLAVELLGKQNVLTVQRSGKALAVKQAIAKFKIEQRYQWLHVADADSVFSPDYFRVYRKKLSNTYVVAVGFVQSLRGNWISTYRALTYTYSQHFNRRIQSYVGMISVFPGPITSFRTDILAKLDFETKTMTEDFDITLQVHRKRLGRIAYIPAAVNYTQDPQSLKDFYKQCQRWQRGFFLGVKKYRVGLRPQRIDIGLGLQMLQTVWFFVQLVILYPIILLLTHRWLLVPVAVASDIVLNGFIAIGSSIAIKRWNLLGALPYFYFLRSIEIFIYTLAFIEVILLGRFQEEAKGWGTEGRRYKLDTNALQDVAR